MIEIQKFHDLQDEIDESIDNDIYEAKSFQDFFTADNQKEIKDFHNDRKFIEVKNLIKWLDEKKRFLLTLKDLSEGMKKTINGEIFIIDLLLQKLKT